MIEQAVTKETCQVIYESCCWEDAIKIASKPQLEKGYIDQTYVDAMIRNVHEYGPYIVIAPKIAIAHATPSDGCSKTSLGITKFEVPVDFGAKDFGTVNILFSLSAPEASSHMKLLQEMISGINTPEKIDKLIKSRKAVELYESFMKNMEV